MRPDDGEYRFDRDRQLLVLEVGEAAGHPVERVGQAEERDDVGKQRREDDLGGDERGLVFVVLSEAVLYHW